ncbi:hypothetical protein GWI33_021765 [Rhynchophorus ferrugineus]|uniref:Uncharacterized protein n=1 Tax=Rhynchophorus ferrugineus TaxID=354439 RepID=A0A834ITD3_RHYFE|nr:hypothetical protein GWI33_021765 [Rhynchophorus ferrugineus]
MWWIMGERCRGPPVGGTLWAVASRDVGRPSPAHHGWLIECWRAAHQWPASVSSCCGFELDHPGSFSTSPWAAVLGHHAAAAASIMQTGEPHGYGAAHHPAAPMDLHMPQAFPYYRYRDDTLCWTDRKPTVDDVGNPSSVNAR